MEQEFFRYAEIIMRIMSCILAVVLASLIQKLVGKGWLVAFTAIMLAVMVGYMVLSIIYSPRHSFGSDVAQWYVVFNTIALLDSACLGIFLFSNYAVSRMNVDAKDLLFSFSGRIPRSAFWIAICILFPLGTLLWLPISQNLSNRTGFGNMAHISLPVIVYWFIFVCYSILCTWIALAVYAKRWHDCSKSGWMTFVAFIPIIGIFWLYGYLGFVRGTSGPNEYGEDPFNIPPDLTIQSVITGNA